MRLGSISFIGGIIYAIIGIFFLFQDLFILCLLLGGVIYSICLGIYFRRKGEELNSQNRRNRKSK